MSGPTPATPFDHRKENSTRLTRDPLCQKNHISPTRGFWATIDKSLLPWDRAQEAIVLDPNQIYYSKTCSASLSKKLLAGRIRENSFFLDWQIGWMGVGQDILAQDPGAHLVPAPPKRHGEGTWLYGSSKN